MKFKALIVYSATAGSAAQGAAKSTIENIFTGSKIDFGLLDGSDELNHPRLRKLFEISQQRGKYPQVFKELVEGSPEGEEEAAQYVGLSAEIIDMNDEGDLVAHFQ